MREHIFSPVPIYNFSGIWPTEDVDLIAWEIFSGAGVWTQAMQDVDVQAIADELGVVIAGTSLKWHMLRPFDVLFSDASDVLDPAVRFFIKRVLWTLRVLWQHHGTPCSSFAAAVTPGWRSEEQQINVAC